MPEPVVRFLRSLDPGPADADLLRRFAETRDQAAFELLVWRHAGMVQATAFAVLRDRHLAEDAAQAAFLALARRAGSVRTNPSGWLYRTARRASLQIRRTTRRAGGVSLPFQPPATTPSRGMAGTGGLHPPLASVVDSDDLAVLHAELARLPDRYRLPVLLCLVEGLTHPAAAARLGWPVGTVAGRLSRAKALLRDRLTRRGVTAGLGLLAVEAVGGGWVSATATAATAFAAGGVVPVSPSVILLAKGLVRAMTVTKLTWAAGLLLAAVTVGGGLMAVGQQPTAGLTAATFAQQPAVPGPPLQVEPTKPNPGKPEDTARKADFAQRQRSRQTLHELLIAFHHFHDVTGHFPADIRSNAGRPLLSWRVAVLPYLLMPDKPGGASPLQPLFQRFNLDEPWDGPTNKPLLAQMPDLYRVGFQPKSATTTYYQGFAGTGTAFEPGQKLTFTQFTDGLSNTLAVAEVGPPVPWTQPADVLYDPAKPFPAVVWPFANLINVAHTDASTHKYTPTVPENYLRLTLSRAGGESNADEGKFKPRLVAETPEEKVELAKLQAEATRLLGEVGNFVPGTTSPEEAAAINAALKRLLDGLRPPAK